MRRGCLVAIAIFVALGVMAAGIAVFVNLPKILPRLPGSQDLSRWVSQNLNAELETGWIAPLIYPGLGVQLRDIEIKLRDPEGASHDFFRAKAIKVVADSRELFYHRKVVWREIRIIRPRIVLVHDVEGKWNAALWAQNLPQTEKKSPEEQGLIRWMVQDSIRKALPTSGLGFSELLAMRRFELRDAEVVVIDQGQGRKGKVFLQDVDLKEVQVKFMGALADDPASFEISFPFPQGPGLAPGPELKLTGAVRPESDSALVFPAVIGRWSGAEIHRLAGRIELKPAFKFEADLDLISSFAAFHRAATWGPIARSRTIPDMRGSGSPRLKVHLWGPDLTRAAKLHYQGTLEVPGVTWDPGRVVAPLENVHAVIRLEDGVVSMPETVISIAGTQVKGEGRMVESKRPRFTIIARTGYVDFKKFFRPRRTPYKPGQSMLVMRTRWGGEAYIGEGVYEKIRIQEAQGEWDVTDKRLLTFPSLSFMACNGTYTESGRSFIDFDHPVEVKFRFDGSIRGMDVTMFTDQLFDTVTFLHGAADADGFVIGKFISGEFVARSLDGDLAITVRDGYLEGFNLVGKLLGVFGLGVPAELKGQTFKRMSARVKFNEGLASFENLEVEAPGLGAEARGWIDFAGKQADIKITLHPRGPLVGLAAAVPIVGPAGEAVTRLYVRAQGPWDNLNYLPWNPLESGMPAPPLPAPEKKGEPATEGKGARP